MRRLPSRPDDGGMANCPGPGAFGTGTSGDLYGPGQLQLANVTSTAVSACFEGFNGKHQHVATLQDVFAGVANDVKARFVQALAAAKGRLAAAVAAVKQALANAAREAAQALQASLNKAQAAKTEKKAQADLAKANKQYAQLLALDQKAVWFQLPGGPAPDVTMQNGIYRYTIKG